jgi:anti-sigma factor RsiW
MSETDPDRDELRLNAALDDELDAAHRLDLERELAGDRRLGAAMDRLSAVRTAVRRHASTDAAPARLHAAVAALGRPTQGRRFPTLAMAACVAAGIIAGAAAQAVWSSLRQPGVVATALVADFARAEIADRPFDVATSDRHVVKPWLATRAPLGVEAVDLASAGYPLAGGRVAVIGATPVPTLVYQRHEHWIAVTELPLSLGRSSGANAAALDGFHLAQWKDNERAYVAVSDIDAPELVDFVAAFRAAAITGAPEPR